MFGNMNMMEMVVLFDRSLMHVQIFDVHASEHYAAEQLIVRQYLSSD